MMDEHWLPLCDRCARLHPFAAPQVVEVNLLDLQLSANDGCSCCKLILHYYGTESDDWDQAEIGCFSTPEVNYGVDALWIRIAHSGTEDKQQEANHVQSLKFDLFQVEETTTYPAGSHLALGQINKDPESNECFSLLHHWIHVCQDGHEKCHQLCSSLPSRLIDVQSKDPVLVKSDGLKGSYTTLSHCWGKQKLPITTCENIAQRYTNIELSELPQTYKDAIKITKRLQIPYLWIDSLCIIQDSVKDWQEESKHMKEYYKNSIITISALDSADSRGGILNQRQERPSVSLSSRGGLFIRKAAFPHREVFGLAPLNARAWALQERLLSTRIVHYSGQEMFWECLTCACREGSPFIHAQPLLPGYVVISEGVDFKRIVTWLDPFSKDKLKSSASFRQQIPGNSKDVAIISIQSKGPLEHTVSESDLDSGSRNHAEDGVRVWLPHQTDSDSIWWRIVSQYSGRGLTKQTDRLPAIAGLASLFHEALQHEYLAGIWREYLDDLLWVVDPWIRMSVPSANQVLLEYGYQAPSWSWAAIPWSAFYPRRGRERTYHTLFDLKIIKTGITPIGIDPFGQVSDGFIKVQGFYLDVIQFQSSAEDEHNNFIPLEMIMLDQARLAFGTAQLDDIYNMKIPSETGIKYTALFVLERGNHNMDMDDLETFTHTYCLLLQPAGNRLIEGQKTWKRVGAGEALRSPRRHSADWSWKEGSFTII